MKTIITIGTILLGAMLAAAIITRLVTPEKGFTPGSTAGKGLDAMASIFRGVFRG